MPPFLSQHPLTCFLGGKNSIATPSSINFTRLTFSMANGNDKMAVLRVQLADGDFLNGGAES